VQHEKTFGHISWWSLNVDKFAHLPSIAGKGERKRAAR
jgi:hypothetical protein